MRASVLAVAGVLAAAGAAAGQTGAGLALNPGPAAASRADAAPTFYRDVLPILQQNCQACHQEAAPDDGGRSRGFHAADLVAPMALETYEQTRPWARVIALVTKERRMPPWSAHVQHQGQFTAERYLEKEEIATLTAWADAGAPAGDPADAPPPLPKPETSESGWAIGEPDLVVQVPTPFTLEENVLDMYVDLHIPLAKEDHPEPRWIKAAQLAPGSSAVHHINSPYLGTIAPGRNPNYWPEGFGILLPAEETLVLDMHYHKPGGPGTAVEDKSGGAFIFYEEGEVITNTIETFTQFPGGEDMLVPAGDPNYSFTAARSFDEDTYLLAAAPHAHLRGKAAKLELEYPDGLVETLIYLPKYDFAWQHNYQFNEPKLMPAGSVLRLTMWWDNSADNPHNPDPTRTIPFGLATTDEMMTGRVFISKAEPIHHVVGDPIPQELFPSEPRWERSRDREPKFVELLDGTMISNGQGGAE